MILFTGEGLEEGHERQRFESHFNNMKIASLFYLICHQEVLGLLGDKLPPDFCPVSIHFLYMILVCTIRSSLFFAKDNKQTAEQLHNIHEKVVQRET